MCQDHATQAVPEEPSDEDVAGEVTAQGDPGVADKSRGAVCDPPDPTAVAVNAGDDCGDCEGSRGVAGGE